MGPHRRRFGNKLELSEDGETKTRLYFIIDALRPSFMGIVFGSGILLDLVLFANRIIAEPKS